MRDKEETRKKFEEIVEYSARRVYRQKEIQHLLERLLEWLYDKKENGID